MHGAPVVAGAEEGHGLLCGADGMAGVCLRNDRTVAVGQILGIAHIQKSLRQELLLQFTLPGGGVQGFERPLNGARVRAGGQLYVEIGAALEGELRAVGQDGLVAAAALPRVPAVAHHGGAQGPGHPLPDGAGVIQTGGSVVVDRQAGEGIQIAPGIGSRRTVGGEIGHTEGGAEPVGGVRQGPHVGGWGIGRRGSAGHAGGVDGRHRPLPGQVPPHGPQKDRHKHRRGCGPAEGMAGGPGPARACGGLLHGGQGAPPPVKGGAQAVHGPAVVIDTAHVHSSFSASFSFFLARWSRESTVFRGQRRMVPISSAVYPSI